ncbi:MAG: hypothetical protein Q7R47_07075 [Candidatus Diapherotrites archaeon]|nr:hypothetical protein [Candidatus Diapherotrites archaeon]
MTDQIKEFFRGLPDNAYSESRIERALTHATEDNQFRKTNYGKYLVLLCGDHNGKEINLAFLKSFKEELRNTYGISCCIGDDYIQKAKGAREEDIRRAYLKDADIIVLINGESPGTLDEYNDIRADKDLKRKTIAFFKYNTFDQIKTLPDLQNYICEFKYPVPYRTMDELKAIAIFGIKHMVLYLINKELITGGGQ